MFSNAKPLIVVVLVAMIVFIAARRTMLAFIPEKDFDRRRNVWLFLTVVGFLSPSFWFFVLFALPTLVWAGKRDPNPLALYLLLLFVVPPVEIPVPVVGINRLFELSNQRLLGLAILLPLVLSPRGPDEATTDSRGKAAGFLLLAFGVWQVFLFVPYEALTNTARRAFLFYLDTYLIFQAFCRLRPSREAFVDLFATLCLSALIFAPLAVFESNKGWLLYTGIADLWGSTNRDAWLFRGTSLRAQVGTGHSIPLGYVFAMALCAWMYLCSLQRMSTLAKSSGAVLLLAGLYFTFARGSWITAALAALLFTFLSSASHSKFAKTMVVAFVVVGGLAMTPLGRPVVDLLPFVGTEGQDTVAYRQQLAEVSWSLIGQHPFIGNPFVMLQMEELRQGQGIIDLVNAYASVALFYGIPGLCLFLGVALVVMYRGERTRRDARFHVDMDAMALGGALIACEIADLFFMGTAGFSWFEWMLLGLLLSYSRMAFEPLPSVSEPSGKLGLGNVPLQGWQRRASVP